MPADAPVDRSSSQHRVTRTIYRRRTFWYRVFRENLWIKGFSLLMTLALFVIVREDKGQEADIEVPVVLSNIGENEVFTGDMPKTLRVRARDRWSRLARALERKANPYLVDLRGFSDQTVYVFDADRIRQLLGVSGLTIQSIYPSEFVVRIENKVERVVPVRANFIGEPQDGYTIAMDRVHVIPPEMHIWGARSSVRQVHELLTYPVNLGTLDKDVRLDVKVQKPALPFIFLDEEEVTIHIPVQTIQDRYTIENQDVLIQNCPEGFVCRSEPAAVRVSLVGPKPLLKQVERGVVPVTVVVDAEDQGLAQGKNQGVLLACRKPAELECRLSQRKVTVQITRAEPDSPRDVPSQ